MRRDGARLLVTPRCVNKLGTEIPVLRGIGEPCWSSAAITSGITI
jgi:hypothetical protein